MSLTYILESTRNNYHLIRLINAPSKAAAISHFQKVLNCKETPVTVHKYTVYKANELCPNHIIPHLGKI